MNDGSPSGQTLCGVPSGIFLFYSFILCLLSQRFCSQNCYTSYILSVIHMLCIFNVCIYIYVIHMYDINIIMYYASCIKCYTYVCMYVIYMIPPLSNNTSFFSFFLFYSFILSNNTWLLLSTISRASTWRLCMYSADVYDTYV